ncbi:hypothetical protein D3C72_1938200 [compost metagenome]
MIQSSAVIFTSEKLDLVLAARGAWCRHRMGEVTCPQQAISPMRYQALRILGDIGVVSFLGYPIQRRELDVYVPLAQQ